jgi:hypothetical protein
MEWIQGYNDMAEEVTELCTTPIEKIFASLRR